ncbi:hypothetical protein BJV82DRAFT_620007 [Fennellomyces sp. T-0311]|nr:hypothetical protein BJV82DRAFT_620007 [Fennellomyces sp. T-0311]
MCTAPTSAALLWVRWLLLVIQMARGRTWVMWLLIRTHHLRMRSSVMSSLLLLSLSTWEQHAMTHGIRNVRLVKDYTLGPWLCS